MPINGTPVVSFPSPIFHSLSPSISLPPPPPPPATRFSVARKRGSFHSVRFSAVLIRCNTVPRGPAPLLPTGYSRVSCPRHPVPSRARSTGSGYVKTLELIGPLPLHSRRNLRKVNRIGVHTLISIRREGDDCCSSRRITNRSHWRSGICCSRPLSS